MLPDLAGFRDAQARKRAAFGEEVTFFGDVQYVWPDGTPIDPETGQPYDPMVQPSSSARVAASALCTIANKSPVDAPIEDSQIGRVIPDHVMVIAPPGASAIASAAVELTVRGEAFDVTGKEEDGVAGIDRYLVWGRRK